MSVTEGAMYVDYWDVDHADEVSWLVEAVLLDSYLSLIRNLNIELKPW